MTRKYVISLDFPSTYVAIDFEFTLGINESIIEVGAIKVENSRVVDTFNTLVRPNRTLKLKKQDIQKNRVKSYFEINGIKQYYIPKFLEELTGITNNELLNAPSEHDIVRKLAKFIGSNVVVGHGMDKDLNILGDTYFKYLKRPFKNKYIDTSILANFLFSTKPQLSKLCEDLNIDVKRVHRAFDDADLTRKCYEVIRNKILSEYTDMNILKEGIISSMVLYGAYDPYGTIKNRFCNKINNRIWNYDKDDILEGYLWGTMDNSIVSISSSVQKSVKRKIQMDMMLVDTSVEPFTVNSEYFIYNDKIKSDTDKDYEKAICAIKNFSNTRMLGVDELTQSIKKSKESGIIFEAPYNYDKDIFFSTEIDTESSTNECLESNETEYAYEVFEKAFYLLGDFLSVSKDKIEERILERGGRVIESYSETVDYFVVGGRVSYEDLIEGNDIKEHLKRLSFGEETYIFNERLFISNFDIILKNKKENL